MPLDTRTKAAGVTALLAFTLAFGVLAADLAWNVNATLEAGGDSVDLMERYVSRELRIPNSTSAELTLVITNDRPIGYGASVAVQTGYSYVDAPPRPEDGSGETGGETYLLDHRVDLEPGETERIPFTVDATEYSGSSPRGDNGVIVGYMPLQVTLGDETKHLSVTIVEETS